MERKLVINLFGGAGAGKSLSAAGIFSLLKLHGINCELVTEFAKSLVWKDNTSGLEDQIYILGNQYHDMYVLKDKVDVIITDSPLLLNLLYGKDSKSHIKLTLELFNGFDNLNYYVNRVKEYNKIGRVQTETEALNIDHKCKEMLNKHKIKYKQINGDFNGINEIVKDVLNIQKIQNNLEIIKIR